MADATPQDRLRELHTRGQELAKLGTRSAEQATEMEHIITEMGAIRSQIEQNDQFNAFDDWANRTAGGIPVASPGGATVQAITPDTREMVVGFDHPQTEANYRAHTLSAGYGDGGMDPRLRAIVDSTAHRAAFLKYLRTPAGGDDRPAIRTLQEASDVAGGFFVPTDFLDRVISKEPTLTQVASKVTHLTTNRDSLTVPRVNYTTDDLYTTPIRVTWTGETPSSATAARVTDPAFSRSQIQIFTAMLSMPLTNDLLEDTGFPLLDWVAGKFRETIDLLKDNMILNGSGLGQPAGILLNPGDSAKTQPAVVVSGSASTLGTDGTSIIKTAMALPPQYDANATFVMNKTNTANAIAQLKDSNGRFLWGSGLQDSGLEPTWRNRVLLGYDVLLSQFMPNIGASTYPVIFGDLSGYYLVDRVGLSIQVLRELYAETNQVLVLGRIRFGGQVVEPWKLLVLQAHT